MVKHHSVLQLSLYPAEWDRLERLLAARYPSDGRIAPYDNSKYGNIRRHLTKQLPVLARLNGDRDCDCQKDQIQRLNFWVPDAVITNVNKLACRNMISPSRLVGRHIINPLLLECFEQQYLQELSYHGSL